jgi:ferredoxin-thioredoxin reductase catalytic subunit
MKVEVSESQVEEVFGQLKKDAEDYGYHLNPDEEFTKSLIRSLLINQERYGYWACPCRLATGIRKKDLDIICPCDYRDPDLSDFGACFCALYVSGEIAKGEKEATSIPERRPTKEEMKNMEKTKIGGITVWRCKVCGYLCAREEPPEICPICKVSKDRFEKFTL